MRIKRNLIVLFTLIFALNIFTIGCSKKDSSQTTNTSETKKEVVTFNQEEFKKSLNDFQSSPENLITAYEQANLRLVNSMGTNEEDCYMEFFYNLLNNTSSIGDKSMSLDQYKKNLRTNFNKLKETAGSKEKQYQLSPPRTVGDIVIITVSVEFEKKTFVNEYWVEKVADKWFVKHSSSK